MLINNEKDLRKYIADCLEAARDDSDPTWEHEEISDIVNEVVDANKYLIPFTTDQFDSPTINFLGYI